MGFSFCLKDKRRVYVREGGYSAFCVCFGFKDRHFILAPQLFPSLLPLPSFLLP